MKRAEFLPPSHQGTKKWKTEKGNRNNGLGFPSRLGVLVVQLFFPVLCFSQTVTSNAGLVTPLSALGASARADALGSAFTGIADDASALFFNSAGLSGLDHAQLSLNHNSYLGGSFEETFLVGLPVGDWGGFAGAVQYVFWGNLDERDPNGVPLGTFTDSDVSLSLGWGREWAKGFSLGLAVHGTQQKVVDSLYNSFSVDLGLLWLPAKDLRVGLTATGLGTPVAGQSLATDFKGGVSNLFHLGHQVALLAALSGYYEPNGVSRLQGGVESVYQKNFFLRVGYQQPLSDNQVSGFTGFTAGAGIRLEPMTLDYAYVPYGDLGTSHRISLSYEFPNPTPVPVIPVTVVLPPIPVKPVTVFATPIPTPLPTVMPMPAKPSVAVHFEVPLSSDMANTSPEILIQIQQYQKATETNPQDGDAWHQLGLLYWKTRQKDLAVQCLEQALRLNPSDTQLKAWIDQYHANQTGIR
jgi:hypothetical protein